VTTIHSSSRVSPPVGVSSKEPALLTKATVQPPPPPAPKLGLHVDTAAQKIHGTVLPEVVEGVPLVVVPGLDVFQAPDPGKMSSFLIASDRLLSLKREADGTVKVETRALGLEATNKKGDFSGAVLPDERGMVDFGGKEISVKGLQPGKKIKKTIKINGKKYKVELRMNEDGSISVKGKRKRGFFSKLGSFFGKAMGLLGKLAPFLAAVPGLGWAALVGKAVGIFNAAKGVVDSIRSGSILGALSSAASLVAGFSRGAAQAIAHKVGAVASFARSVGSVITNGLGRGFFQVVSNGLNLLSSGAGLLGANKGLSSTLDKAASYAAVAEAASRGNLLIAVSHLVDVYGPEIAEKLRKQPQVQYSIYSGFRFNTDPKELLAQLGYDPSRFDFSKVSFDSPEQAGAAGSSSPGHNKPSPGHAALNHALGSLGIGPANGTPGSELPGSNLVAGPWFNGDAVMDYLTGLSDRLQGFGCAVTSNPLHVFGIGAKCGTDAINQALGVPPMPDNDNTRQGEIAGVVAMLPFLAQALEKNVLNLAQLTNPAYNGKNLGVLRSLGRSVGFGTSPASAALSGAGRNTPIPGSQRMVGGPAGARQPNGSGYCGHCTAINVHRAAGGSKYSMWELVRTNPPAADGLNLLEVRDILRAMGNKNAMAIRSSNITTYGQAIDQTGLPVIVLRGGHYYTIDAVKNGHVYFRDSTAGSFRAPVSSWSGNFPGVVVNR